MTEPQIRFVATRYAGAQKMTRSEARRLRQHNPSFLVLHYRLGQALGHSLPSPAGLPTTDWINIVEGDCWVREWPGDGHVRDDWFFRWNGARLFSEHGHYLMELDDPDFRAWWTAEVVRQLQANEADGVFADSYGIPTRSRWTPPFTPVDPCLEARWAERQRRFTDYVRRQFAGRWKWIPNVGAYLGDRDPSDYSNTDGVMIERFAHAAPGRGYEPGDWRLQMNRALAFARENRIVIAQSYPGPDGPEERLFALGSYLLIRARHTYINLCVQDKATAEAHGGFLPEWLPEYELDLGEPRDPLPAAIDAYLHPSWNMYVRRYAGGVVVVNPAATARTAHLGSTYRRAHPVGGGVVAADGTPSGALAYVAEQTVTLGPRRAAVLVSADRQAERRVDYRDR